MPRDKSNQLQEVFFCLSAASILDKIILNAELCSLSIKDRKDLNELMRSLSGKSNPVCAVYEQDIANETIEVYNKYKSILKRSMFDRDVVDSFCHWYAKLPASNRLKMDIMYILPIGLAMYQHELGLIDDLVYARTVQAIIKEGESINPYRPMLATRSLVFAMDMLNSIKTKCQCDACLA